MIQCGSLSLDAEKIEKQLRQDFRDDWFPDPLSFSDLFSGEVWGESISANIQANSGAYLPEKAQLLNIPKANFTLRYALETSLADRAIYHGLASELLPYFDPLISWQVFSHRLPTAERDRERAGARYMFRSGIRAWSDFLGCVESKLSATSVLLSTDLANYFENISIPLLRTRFLELAPEVAKEEFQPELRTKIEELFSYLSSWCFKEDRGLPQNRDASSFLANVYMLEVDKHMIEAGYRYFRYMDDIKIVCDNKAAARKALKELILALRPVGQFVNSGKTKIVEATERQLLQQCLSAGSTEMKRIATAWSSKSLKPISRTLLPLKHLTLETLRNEKFDSREFRFCIGRLETIARSHEFKVPSDFFSEITGKIIEGLDIAPVATDQMVRYLRAVPLDSSAIEALVEHVKDPDKTIYNWKNYRIWLLLAQKKILSDDLKLLSREIIETHRDDPTRAGASLYLGCVGTKEDREFIAKRFADLKSYLGQRTAIIAIQELHFSGKSGNVTIKDAVAPFLRSDLRGTYSNLNRAGTYVTDLEPLSVTNFLDLERDYA